MWHRTAKRYVPVETTTPKIKARKDYIKIEKVGRPTISERHEKVKQNVTRREYLFTSLLGMERH